MRISLEKASAFKYPLLLLISALLLQACVASMQLVQNKNAEVKKYGEVYIMAPQQDPRNILPQVVDEFKKMGLVVSVVDSPEKMPGSQGTGFLITDKGHILTCAHVLGEQNQATVWLSQTRFEADVISKNKDLDVAILKLRNLSGIHATPVSFRENKACRMGEDAFTIGFPLSKVLGDSARLSKGLVSATAGLKDSPNQIQISAEIQPGNSGGPVFDGQGMVFGVVQQTLNPTKIYQQTGGALPQNVNFAIRSDVVLEFIKTSDPGLYDSLRRNQGSTIEKIADSTVKVRSSIISEDLKESSKLVVRLQYQSFWDMWFRFRYFAITIYDFDSQDQLLIAGQRRYNPMSSEEIVIRDTFAQIRKTLGLDNHGSP
ncbi:conserved exported hypothetical protein [Syntrophobacter sp. SbD1]|nr:conserved exported hypothetical protein [Syntrophobacter sp. SbD1]